MGIKSAGEINTREKDIQERTGGEEVVYKRTNRYFDSWHRRRIVDTMDVEHSTEDNSKVEREGLEEYEQDVFEGNFEEEKTEGGNFEVEKYKVI